MLCFGVASAGCYGLFIHSNTCLAARLNLQANIGFNISSANPNTLAQNNTINSAGHTLWTGAGIINVGYGSVFNNTGSFGAQNDSQFYNNTGNTPLPVFVNNGSFTKTNSTGTTLFNLSSGGVAFNNNGTVSVQSGNLTLGGGGIFANDSFTVAAGSLIDFTAGSFFFNGSRTLTGPGTNRVNGASVTFNHGTNALGGTITFEIAAGVVKGTNTFSGVGTVNWSGGTIGGSCTIPGTVTLNLIGGDMKTLAQNSTINSAGNTLWTGAGIINVG